MTKRYRRKYKLLSFYEEDFFGRLVLKDPINEKDFFEGYKNLKVNKLLLEKVEEKVERRIYFKKHGRKEQFYYRIDVGKPRRSKRRLSIFGSRLKLRQKIRKFASQMTVRQFRSYIKKSSSFNKLYIAFLKFLESRLDFLVYRMNLVDTSLQSRFLINHGNFIVNGIQCFFPSYSLKNFEIVSVLNKQIFYDRINENIKQFKIFINTPLYIEINFRILSGMIIFAPTSRHVPYPSKFKSEFMSSIGKRFKS